MTDGQVIKSLWDSGKGTWQIHEITGLEESRVYNILAAYSRERYSVYGQHKVLPSMAEQDAQPEL